MIKNIFYLLTISLTMQVMAQKNVESGTTISAQSFNSSTLSIGSIQQSLLSQSQFQNLNGDCWVIMQGQDISGSNLASLGINPLPDARGRFLRTLGNETVAVGSTRKMLFNNLLEAFLMFKPKQGLQQLLEAVLCD